jgi:hypothetical protein
MIEHGLRKTRFVKENMFENFLDEEQRNNCGGAKESPL